MASDKPWGKGFLTDLARFRAQLDASLEEPLLEIVTLGEPADRVEQPPVVWKPIDCKSINIDPKVIASIHEGKRNDVFKVKDENTGRHYVMKTFRRPEEYTAELALSMLLNGHPYFVRTICTHHQLVQNSKDDQKKVIMIPAIIYEFIEGGKSTTYAAERARPQDIQRISKQLLLAMYDLHRLGYIHADLKPENVMIDADGNAKVIDLGFGLHPPHYKLHRGTHSTMAPELFEATHGAVHEGVDMWAYGSTVGIWAGMQAARSKHKQFIPMYLTKSTSTKYHHYEESIDFGVVPTAFSSDLRSFLYPFFSPDPELRRFNTKRQLNFLLHSDYLKDVAI